MVRMGCPVSSRRVGVPVASTVSKSKVRSGETIVAALARLDNEVTAVERAHPAARLAVVEAELDILHQEIASFEEMTHAGVLTKDLYAQTMHQIFVSLNLYKRPMLASENEDFVANVNRKEMHRLELVWLRNRYSELQKERTSLQAQILHLKALYAQMKHLLDSIWSNTNRPGLSQEGALKQAVSLRDALAAVSARLRAAAEYAHHALRLLDDALPAWKLTTVGKSGWERTSACADACRLFVRARCTERGARRVLSSPAAPRAARTLRLALDYAFTDTMHDHKYQRATEIFFQFKEALIQLVDSIHQVLLNTLENLSVSEKQVVQCRRELRAARINDIARKGLAELVYQPGAVSGVRRD